MQVQDNSVVSIHYTLTNDSGAVVDTSNGHAPLAYIQGQGHIVPGLERAMEGRKVGDKFAVKIAPQDGYGLRDDSLLDRIPKDAFQGVPEIEPGMEFYADGPNGPIMITVKEVLENEVVVDGNHPLAGQALNFAIEVVEVRAATDEEKEHGHVHGEGGHQH